ncbi:MAG: type I-E CRISPR-associated protein Cas5/CasD [Bacillota bacterium]|jgi:CRISPR system Cascade subunit CasD
MSTLLLRLAAPLQSWGAVSKFNTRDTAREPTKSGVIGLLAAALGRNRAEPLDDLARLSFGVRIDQPGTILRDWHNAKKAGSKNPDVTTRYYLADAVFLVGLEGDRELLEKLATALKNPVFPLYLGRRSCPPEGLLVLGLREKPLRQALEEEDWQASEWFQQQQFKRFGQVKLTIVCDANSHETAAFLRRDVPESFDQWHRRYGFRRVVDIPDAVAVHMKQSTDTETDHDAMAGWEG